VLLKPKKHISMVVQGDDNLMTHDGDTIDFKTAMAEFGFDAIALYRPCWQKVEFCSNIVYNTTDGLVLGPKPGKVLAKFGFFVNRPKNVPIDGMLRGVALGLVGPCAHIPPIACVIRRVLTLTSGVRPVKTSHDSWKMNYKARTSQNCDVLSDRYGWDDTLQYYFEEAVLNWKIGDDMDCSVLDILCDRDTAGPRWLTLGYG